MNPTLMPDNLIHSVVDIMHFDILDLMHLVILQRQMRASAKVHGALTP